MKKIKKTISADVLSYRELNQWEKKLLANARLARLNAQAPYSNYWVGCCLMSKNGRFVKGCNVENVNWSETIHAEGNAISSAVAQLGPFAIKAMAVVAAPAQTEIIWPPKPIKKELILSVNDICPSCGKCLQSIAENCIDKNGRFDPGVLLYGYKETTGEIFRTTIGDAYPMPFLPQHLGINYANDPRVKNV